MAGIELVFGFFGGGVLIGVLEWIRTKKSEIDARKFESLKDQLTHLYGPLYFLTSQNDDLFKLYKKYHKVYEIEYGSKEWSQDDHTQTELDKELDAFFKISNDFMEVVKENNYKIIELLANKYTYIDIDDIDDFRDFSVDYIRMKIEINRIDKLKVPYRIYKRIGEISYMRPKFIKRVNKKFHLKYDEMEEMQTNSTPRHIERLTELFQTIRDEVKKK